MKQKIVLIGNPIAGKGATKKIEKAFKIIKDRGFDVELKLTEKKGDAELFAREIGKQSVISHQPSAFNNNSKRSNLLIIAGGDGTYNEVINGTAGTDVPIAILPLGTTNVLAKELNIPENNIEKALDIALNSSGQKVSLGRITLMMSGIAETRHFLLMAGIGYDGEAVCGVSNKLKNYTGKGAYIWSGLKTLLRWNPDKLIFDIDGKIYEGYSAIICNASKYAGNFRIAPDADIKKPYLYVFVIYGRRRLDILKHISDIVIKRHQGFRNAAYLKAEKIEIKGTTHIQIDGDYLGQSPAVIELVQNAVRLVY